MFDRQLDFTCYLNMSILYDLHNSDFMGTWSMYYTHVYIHVYNTSSMHYIHTWIIVYATKSVYIKLAFQSKGRTISG